ncbi:M56 family metallopeptidase [Saccharibacillus qingshengii]|uniref:M56 family metallopeptidase n=1 Tax=Saccharibacillus qingshengii TaxID=1763540 RepID=UPI0015566DA0|nr:M56 family metallopeptidase [Saccharibacillus qingshengii]
MSSILHTLSVLLETFFRQILLLSIMGSILVPIILVLRRMLRTSLRPVWIYLLWLPLLARLLIPWSPESPVSLYAWMPESWSSRNTGEQALPSQQIPERSAGQTGGDLILPNGLGEGTAGLAGLQTTAGGGPLIRVDEGMEQGESAAASFEFSWLGAASLLWITGVFILLGTGTVSAVRFGRRIRYDASNVVPERERIEALIGSCASELKLRRSPDLIVTARLSVPTVFGVWKPRLLLPAELPSTLAESRLRHIVMHELAHIKRLDIAVNLLAALLTALHWFNPLVAIAVRKLRQDQEAACDAKALGLLPEAERREYGLTLIALLERGAAPLRLPGASGLWSGKKDIKRRMVMIAKYRKNTWKSMIAGALAILLLGGCALAGTPSKVAGSDPDDLQAANRSVDETTAEASGGGSAESPSSKRVNERVEVPAEGGEGYKLSAYDDLSVYMSAHNDPDHPLLSRFTIRQEEGRAAAYLWNYASNGGTHSVLISRTDMNGDKKEDIVLLVPTGSGTELSLQEAHVLDGETLNEIPIEDPVAYLQQTMKSSIVQQDGEAILNAELNGAYVTKRYEAPVQSGWLFDQVGFGAIVYYTLAGNTLTARLEGRASVTEFPLTVTATYDQDLSIADTQMSVNGGLAYTDSELPAAILDRMGIVDPKASEGWRIRWDNHVYRIEVPGSTGSSGQGASYGANTRTGTVFDGTSGAPIMTLARISGEESKIDTEGLLSSNGTVYLAALDKRLRFLAKNAGWTPIGDDWLNGFDGNGNVLCRVEWKGDRILVKVDVFTGLWSETQ